MNEDTTRRPPAPETPSAWTAPRRPARPPLLDSRALFAGANEVLIRHGGELYRLRLTQAGKLILTK
jgi:hemin uptake protein HemP